LRARGLAIVCISSAALLDSIQSFAKHATECLDGNHCLLSDRAAPRTQNHLIAIDRFRIRMLINVSSYDLYDVSPIVERE